MAVVHACTTAAKQSCENYIGPLARTYTRTHALMHTQTHTHTHAHTRTHTTHTILESPNATSLSGFGSAEEARLQGSGDQTRSHFTALTGIIAPPNKGLC